MPAPARSLRLPALAAATLIAGCGDGGSTTDAPDASRPSLAAGSGTLALARELATPERSVADVLAGRLAFAPDGAGLSVTARSVGDLELHVARTAGAPTWIGTDRDHAIAFAIEGASDAAVEAEGGAAIHRDALPGTDAIWATTEARAELLFLLRDGASPRVRLRLERGSGLEAPIPDQGGLTFRDARGNARLHVPAPVALDARGVRRVATMRLADDGRTLSIDLDDAGLERPILLDPAVLQGRWTLIGDRDKRTMGSLAWDPGRAKLIGFGGYHAGSYHQPGAAATGLFEYTFPGRTFDALANGPGVFTSAMMSGSPPFYEYGWFAAFDSHRGKLVAVGSSQWSCEMGCATTSRMEVHEWDSATNTWAQRCTSGACAASAPSRAQTDVEVVYDANRKLTVVCATSSRACSTWNGATETWTSIASFPVAMRRGFYDAKHGSATFLGQDGTYSWTGSAWTKRTTSTSFPLAVTYDTIRKRAVALVGNGLNADTYEWDGTSGAWTLIVSASSATPWAKAKIAMGFDPVNGRVVAWGGGDGQQGYYSFDFLSTVFEYQAFGNACAGDVDCLGGSCRDGFCCDTKCGACRRCDGPGAGGTCAPFAGAATGTEHDTCTGANACSPLGECKRKPGQTCTSGTECVTGACVDGFCCATPCNQACEVCNVTPGTCTPAAKGSSGRTSCGVGTCNGTSRTCSTSCTTDADCSASGWCDAGTCTATRSVGVACTRDRQCTTGSCRDGVCCSSGCNGPCEACTKAKGASADGACTPLPASSKPAACGGYACSGTSGACAASCETDAGCGAGYWCDGAFCQKARAQGDSCTRTDQCASGLTCADGVCCNSACDGACQACSAANKQSGDAPGVCGPAKAGSDPGDRCPTEDPSTCGKSGVCGAGGTCALWPKGAACGGGVACEGGTAKGRTCDGLGACVTDATGTACAPGTCTAAAGCTFACTTDAECDAAGFCDAGTCKARSTNGRTCTASNQCASGHCVDGVCCATACGGVCEACNGVGTEGTCTAVAGPPREGHGACPGKSGDDPCTAAACDGETRDACKAFAGPEVTCRAASCVDAVETLATKCDGSGKCPTASTKACAPFGCTGERCSESCTTDEECANGNRCDATTGKCVSNGTCDGDHTVIGADGTKTDCAPFKCDDGGCKTTCTSSDECAAPAICDGTRCVAAAVAEEDAGGCATSSRPTRGSFFVAAMAVALVATRRARKGVSR